MIAKYRKKPIVIEAADTRDCIHSAKSDWKGLPSWISAAYEKGDIFFGNDYITISTLEGKMTADIDDMIIKGVKGELYPCKRDIFLATYEQVE